VTKNKNILSVLHQPHNLLRQTQVTQPLRKVILSTSLWVLSIISLWL